MDTAVVSCRRERARRSRLPLGSAPLILKYGGSLLAHPQLRAGVADEIVRAYQQRVPVVVVASAMGRAGDPYATDTLLRLAGAGSRANTRALDLLLATGETIATAVLCGELGRRGLPAVPVGGWAAGIRTTDEFGGARIRRVRPTRIARLLDEGSVPVVPGFQGITAQGEITTLGRGGSDLTAVALGAALRARRVELVKDVDGVMTADPALVPEARRLDCVTYSELAALARLGARVSNAASTVLARRARVPLLIRRLGASDGTLVLPDRAGGACDSVRALAVSTPMEGEAGSCAVVSAVGRFAAGGGFPRLASRALRAGGIQVLRVERRSRVLSWTVGAEDARTTVRILHRLGLDTGQAR